MLTTAALEITSLRISEFFKNNQHSIQKSLVRVSSGKRFVEPADAVSEYFRTKQIKADIRGLQQIQRELSMGIALTDTAKGVGTTVFEDLTRMQELFKSYYDPRSTTDQRTIDQTEFEVIKNRIADETADAYYDDWKLVKDCGTTPLMSIILDPRDISMTYDISYDAGDVTDVSGLSLGVSDQATEQAALQEQLNHAASYLAKSVVFNDALAMHRDLISQKSITYEGSAENAENIDEGAEIMALVKKNINQQMAVSMLAQANMFRIGIAALAGATGGGK
jgi:flagellin